MEMVPTDLTDGLPVLNAGGPSKYSAMRRRLANPVEYFERVGIFGSTTRALCDLAVRRPIARGRGKIMHIRTRPMVTVGLWVRLEAKPGHEADLAAFLHAAAALAGTEPQTLIWFAVRLAPSTFGIFDAFPDEAGRAAHLMGPVAQALGDQAPTLLAGPPVIERLDVLAAKQP
jgi:quinol monooxygenase YgiN